jgi:glycosyltransferase involved in cell wall biosynthesis
LGRWAVHLADGRHVVYCVLSTDEQRLFNQRWGIDGARVRFTPYFASLPTQLVASASDDGYIFAGGNTNRDYGLLVEAAEDLDFPVRIASSWKPSRRLPDNVTVNWLPHDDYNRAMAGASLVVVPLYETARSVGQQTYLSAMLLGKPVIVTDAPGVRDYLQPGETAHVVDRDPVALRAAIDWVLDPGNRASVQAMTERARKAVDEKYLRSHYFSRLWQAAAEEVVSRSH